VPFFLVAVLCADTPLPGSAITHTDTDSTSRSAALEAGPSKGPEKGNKGKGKGKTKTKSHKAQQSSANPSASSKEPRGADAGTKAADTAGAAQKLQTESDREFQSKRHDGRGLISAALDALALAMNMYCQYGIAYLGGCHISSGGP
jgi:hypothetical protein